MFPINVYNPNSKIAFLNIKNFRCIQTFTVYTDNHNWLFQNHLFRLILTDYKLVNQNHSHSSTGDYD